MLARLIRGLLFDTGTSDPLSVGIAMGFLALAAAMAAIILHSVLTLLEPWQKLIPFSLHRGSSRLPEGSAAPFIGSCAACNATPAQVVNMAAIQKPDGGGGVYAYESRMEPRQIGKSIHKMYWGQARRSEAE